MATENMRSREPPSRDRRMKLQNKGNHWNESLGLSPLNKMCCRSHWKTVAKSKQQDNLQNHNNTTADPATARR